MSKSVSGIPMLLEVLVQGLPMFADIRLRMVSTDLIERFEFHLNRPHFTTEELAG
jgi:hypothetical protein